MRNNLTSGRLKSLSYAVSIPLLLAAALGLHAAERFMGVSELARAADVAVKAKIVKVKSRHLQTEAGRFSFIIYTAENERTLFGECPPEFTFRVPGLVTDERIVAPAETPRLAPGQEVVLFLKKAKDQKDYALAAASGALPVIPAMAPAGEKGWPDDHVVLLPPRKAADGRAVRVRLKLSDLAAQAKAARQNRSKKEAAK